jgi:multidrug efflux pump subunit AcrB
MAGISISTISVMAFILVLGILVDDAIVVGERVYAHEQQGKNQIQAAIDGTQEVSMPVIFGVFTTMAAFIPIMNIPGSMGGFFGVLGQVVLIALFFSIVESQLILPSHLAHRKPESKQGSNALVNRWLSLQEKISGALEQAANQYYLPAVSRAIQWRYVTLATGIAIVAITSALFVSGRVGIQFLPSVDGTRLYAALTMPEGTPIKDTAKASATIERAAAQLQRELDGELEPGQASRIRHVFSSVGAMLPKGSINGGTSMQSNVAEIAIELNLPSDYSGPSTRNFAHRWRELTGDIPDVVELAFTSQSFSAGKAIDIELYCKNFDSLRSAAAELRSALQHFNGVFDITDTFRTGKQEVQLQLLPEARTLGLTMADLGNQVRQAFYGYEAQRIQRGKDDIRVMVRYPADERRSLGDLENMRIRAADGTEVPFAGVAQTSLAPGYTTIRRVDGHRVVRVIADVERSITTPEFVLRQLRQKDLQEILQRHPGVNYRLAGEAEERDESMGSLFSNTLLALLIIFALLAIPLRSYLQPLIIMSVIPFGAVGAIVGHYILGMDLVFFSLLGIVALSGVVVNSSLVLVDYINNTRKSGQDIESVVSHAGSVRFRPIILTSVTTFVGLTPMMLDGTTSTIMFAPMAVSLAFGVLFGTIITLFLVPSLYMILEDLLTLAGKRNAFEPSTDQHG